MLSAMKSRRGVTLAEIMVALALVAVMITMVVSFTLLITERTRANTANDALRQDRQMVESGVEGWLDAVTGEGAMLSSSADTVTATVGEETFTLQFVSRTLTGTLPGGQDITIHTQNVKAVSFDMMKKDNSADYLLFCTVISVDPDSGEELTPYVFCVNPRVGENGGTS